MIEQYRFPSVDRNSFKPIYVQVSEMIIDYAKYLNLAEGDLLPSENQLLSMLDVSRNTVRQAVDRLVKMNFAIKQRGQGTFIAKRERSVNLDLTQGFEGTLHRLGIKVENRLVEKTLLKNRVDWIDGLSTINSESPMLIRRIKMSSGQLLALEDRVIASQVIERYSDDELENENINPNLMSKYPDTDCTKFKYYFVTKPLTRAESDLLNLKAGDHFLQRIGEYYNSAGECFMIGRHIFLSSQIQVSYEIEKIEGSWRLT